MLFPNASANETWPIYESDSDRQSSATVQLPENDRLVEQVDSSHDVTVDRSSRQVKNVAIAGTVSRNGYRYAVDALRRAVPLYAGRPVFLDHSTDPEQPQTRSTRDLVGTLESVRFAAIGRNDEEGTIRGDIRVLDTESGRTFLALCESNEPGVGMSHVVMARRSEDGSVVESIEKVVSVDAVMFPATTSRLSEQKTGGDLCGDESATNELLSTELVESHADCDECRGRISDLEAERDQLRVENERLVVEARVVGREKMLAESGLPASAVSIVFREAVLDANDEETARRLIDDRAALVRETAVTGPTSDPRVERVDRHDGFAETIRGRR